MPDYTDDYINSLLGGEDPTPSESVQQATQVINAVDPELAAPLPTKSETFTGWTAPFEYLKAKWQLADQQVVRGVKGFEIKERNLNDVDEAAAIANLDKNRLTEVEKSVSLFESELGEMNILRFGGDAASFGPSMLEATKGGALGAIPGAALGAGVGAISGNLTGVGLTLPEEVLTVPGGAVVGAGYGFAMGSFLSSSKMATGDTYLQLRESGISQQTSRNVSSAVGAMVGALEFFQVKGLSVAGKKAFIQQLKTEGGKAALKTFVSDYLKETGEQVVQEDLQEITAIVGEGIAGLVEQNPDVIPVWEDTKNADGSVRKGIISRMVDTTVSTARGSAVLVGGSKATGAAAGKVSQVFKNPTQQAKLQEAASINDQIGGGLKRLQEGDVSLKEAFNVVKEVLSSPQEAFDKADVARAEQMTQGQALDDLFSGNKVAQGEGGKIILETGISKTQQPSSIQDQIVRLQDELSQRQSEGLDTAITEGQIRRLEGLQAQLQEPVISTREELAGRQKQVSSEIRTLDRELSKLEDEFSTRVEEGKATKAVENRISKLQDLRDTLDTERALLREGLLSTDELGGTKTQVSTGKIQSLRAKTTQKVLQAFDKGMKEGVRLTKQNIKEVQNQLTGLIRSSDMSLNDKAKFITSIKNIQTQQQLENALPDLQRRIAEFTEKDFKASAQKRLERLTKQALPKKGGKNPQGKFTADIQDSLESVIVAVKNPQMTLESLAEKIFNGEELSLSEEYQLDIAQRLAPVGRDATAAEIDAVASEIQELITTGRNAATEILQKERAALQENVDIAVESATKGPDFKLPDPVKRVQQWIDSTQAGFFPWDSLMEVISEYDPDRKLMDVMDTHNAEAAEAESMHKVQHGFVDRLAEAFGIDDLKGQVLEEAKQNPSFAARIAKVFGSRELMKRMTEDSKKNISLEYLTPGGSVNKLKMNRMQLRALYMTSLNPEKLRQLREGKGFTLRADGLDFRRYHPYTTDADVEGGIFKSTESAIRDAMTESDFKIVDFTMGFLNNEYYGRANQAYRKRYRINLPKVDQYYPTRTVGLKRTVRDDVLNQVFERASLTPGAFKNRVKNNGGVLIENDMNTLQRHIADVEHMIAWGDTIRTIGAVLSNPDFEDNLIRRYGQPFRNLVHGHYEKFIQDRHLMLDMAFNIFDTVRTKLVTGKLGFSGLDQVLKQATSAIVYMDFVNPVEYAAGLVDFAKNPVEAAKTLLSEPTIKTRWRNLTPDIRDMYNTSTFSLFQRDPTLKQLLMLDTTLGDGIAVMGAWTVYHKEIKAGKPKAEALKITAKAIAKTQQSGLKSKQNAWQQSNGIAKLATTFLSQPNQWAQIEAIAYRDAVNSIVAAATKTKSARSVRDAVQNAVKKFAIYHVGAPVFFQLVANGFSFDDDEDWYKYIRAGLLGNLNGYFIFGETLEYLASSALAAAVGINPRGNVFPPGEVITEELGTDFLNLGKKIAAVFEEEKDTIDLYAEAVETNSKLGDLWDAAAKALDITGAPVNVLNTQLRNIQAAAEAEDPWALALALGGWPKSVVKDALSNGDLGDEIDLKDVEASNESFAQRFMEGLAAPFSALQSQDTAPTQQETSQNDILDLLDQGDPSDNIEEEDPVDITDVLDYMGAEDTE